MIELKKLKEIKEAISATIIHLESERSITAAFVLGQCYEDLVSIIGEDEEDAGNSTH